MYVWFIPWANQPCWLPSNSNNNNVGDRILILMAIMHHHYITIEGLAENWGANMHFFKSEGTLAPLPPTFDTYDHSHHLHHGPQ